MLKDIDILSSLFKFGLTECGKKLGNNINKPDLGSISVSTFTVISSYLYYYTIQKELLPFH